MFISPQEFKRYPKTRERKMKKKRREELTVLSLQTFPKTSIQKLNKRREKEKKLFIRKIDIVKRKALDEDVIDEENEKCDKATN